MALYHFVTEFAGLVRELGCRLVFLEHRTLRPDAPGFGRLPGAPVS